MDKGKLLKNISDVIADGSFSDSWDSLEDYQVPDWYQDDKFGIFIHWGPYCVPAYGNEWYPRRMYIKGTEEYEHHLETYGPHDKFGYKDFIPQFKAEKFAPETWAELFKKSGARFVVPVAEHHDGFQMYDSVLSRWNSVNMGPKRDIIGELAEAVRSQNLTFGLSTHRAEHWWFFGEGREFDSDIAEPENLDFYGPARGGRPRDDYILNQPDQVFLEDWLLRTCELVEKYEPKIVWFDWWIMNLAFKPYLKKFAAYYYNMAMNWNKGGAINYKYDAFPVDTAVLDIERGQLNDTRWLFWQTDTSVSKNSWGYINEHDYKTANDIICDLIDIVSKNGALLLNIGPKLDGTIPKKEQEILLEIGKWLTKNGEAVYETRPYKKFGEGPTDIPDGAFTDTKRTLYTSEDIRFTTKNKILYATVLNWPENNQIKIKTLGKNSNENIKVNDVKILGYENNVSWNIDDDGLSVKTNSLNDNSYPIVIKIK